MKRIRKSISIVALSIGLMGCSLFQKEATFVQKGMDLIGQEKYEQALQEFESASGLKEEKSLIYRGIGLAKLGLKDYEGSINAFLEALEYVKYSDEKLKRDILLYLTSVYEAAERYEEAIGSSTKALGIIKDSLGYYLRGRSYLLSERLEEAEGDFKEALHRQKGDFELYQNIYQTYKEEGKSADGTRILQSILNTDNQLTSLERGIIYYTMENMEDGITYLESAANAGDNGAYYFLGQAFLEVGNAKGAIDAFQTWIDRNNGRESRHQITPGMAYNGQARGYIQLGEYEKASQAIEAGLAAQKKSKDTEVSQEVIKSLAFNKIVILEKQEKYDQAYQEAIRFVEAYPQDKAGIKERDFLKTRQ